MVRIMTIEDYEGVYALWKKIKGFGIRSIDDSKEGGARMDKVQQIPLAERLQSAGARSMGLPVAMGLYAEDFIGLVGQMTGREEHYTDVYATHIKPYEGEDDGKSVRNMVVTADTLPPAEKTTLLFRLLVEPFAALEYMEVSDK